MPSPVWETVDMNVWTSDAAGVKCFICWKFSYERNSAAPEHFCVIVHALLCSLNTTQLYFILPADFHSVRDLEVSLKFKPNLNGQRKKEAAKQNVYFWMGMDTFLLQLFLGC